MKAAYVKLRQLIDAGCIFIGHGLKKDFEMINVVIPPSQARIRPPAHARSGDVRDAADVLHRQLGISQ
eukprot:2309803-Prymnesium_polylepis.1